MKMTILFLFTILYVINVRGQIINNDSLYTDILKRHILYLDSLKELTKDSIYIQSPGKEYCNLPYRIKGVQIILLNYESANEMAIHRAINVSILKPLMINKNELYIPVFDFGLRTHKKVSNYINHHVSYYYYLYKNGAWEYEKDERKYQ